MMTGLAHLGHLVIYLLFIALPVIGLVMMYNRGNPWFGVWFDDALRFRGQFRTGNSLKSWHETLANLGYFVIGLHAAAALAHHYFWKDNTLLPHDAA
ncbi:cytochrome b561 [Escherichia coli]|nr:cytochrome b561 [Escherichia coli]